MTVIDWQQNNQTVLTQALTRIRDRLEQQAHQPPQPPPPSTFTLDESSNLGRLCATFNLSEFERDLLLLCAGTELDSHFAPLCALAQNDKQKTYATFSLALSVLENPHWSALNPDSPLRRWHLIEVGGGQLLTQSPLRIDERILHYLAGIENLDERLWAIVEPIASNHILVASHQRLAQNVVENWSKAADTPVLPAVQLCGEDNASKQAIAQAACNYLNLNLYRLDVTQIPNIANERLQLLRLWQRESILSQSSLLLDCDDIDLSRHGEAIAWLIEHLNGPLVISTQDPLRSRQRPLLNIDVDKPTSLEQYQHWESQLGSHSALLNGQVKGLVAQFHLSAPAIQAACTSALSQTPNPEHLATALWDACRAQARPRMEDLAQRIEARASWDDLILPDAATDTLRTMAAHLRQRAKVYESWGFSGKSGRGLGISALFAGPSGTGKTTAAEVLANELRLDIYKIDLSSVVSKYIGETEKNLRRVFDAAESGGAILLFDEADALFGKRSEVKDSHDRHANIEVSYLLQRMEAYQGLAILTTNMKGALDVAFMRRIRFIVQFSFPDAKQRAEIWRRVFPKETPTEGLIVEKLAKLSIAGGNIRNIALNAAFLAADADEPVMMKHLFSAVKSEYMKLEKPIVDSEFKGWT
jgi:AAA+ superfamily predicted ATPase